jgi:hypothetical protein
MPPSGIESEIIWGFFRPSHYHYFTKQPMEEGLNDLALRIFMPCHQILAFFNGII